MNMMSPEVANSYTFTGFLIIAIIAVASCLVVVFRQMQKKNEQMYLEAKEQHKEEKKDLKEEIVKINIQRKEEVEKMNIERKEERKEWLIALEGNTNQLKNVADKLEIIPKIQKDLDKLQEDVSNIKYKVGGK